MLRRSEKVLEKNSLTFFSILFLIRLFILFIFNIGTSCGRLWSSVWSHWCQPARCSPVSVIRQSASGSSIWWGPCGRLERVRGGGEVEQLELSLFPWEFIHLWLLIRRFLLPVLRRDLSRNSHSPHELMQHFNAIWHIQPWLCPVWNNS